MKELLDVLMQAQQSIYKQSIKRIAYSTAIAYGATASVEYDISHHPAVINDPKVTKNSTRCCKKNI